MSDLGGLAGAESDPARSSERMSLADEVRIRSATVRMRDGVELVADVYMPRCLPSCAALPTILERTPYDRTRLDLHLMGRFFAARGYAVVIQDTRGRYESGGDFCFHTMPKEDVDGYDTVEWIAARPWCDGRVGTTGISYGGAVQQALAVAKPAALTTQIVLDAGYNYWARMVRQAGAFSRGVHFPYALWMAMTGHEAAADPAVRAALARALDDVAAWIARPSLRRGCTPLALAPSYERWYFDMAERAEYDDVWRNPLSSLEAHVDEYPDIPICFVSSWYGHHAEGNLLKFMALRERLNSPVKLIVGPWQHGLDYTGSSSVGEVEFGNRAALELNALRLRWFERWLKKAPDAAATGTALELFVMGGGSGRRDAAHRMRHGGRWTIAEHWPLAAVTEDQLHLHPDGALRPQPVEDREAATSYVFDPRDPVPTIGGGFQDPLGGERAVMRGGGFDQRSRPELPLCRDGLPLAARHDVLVFRSRPLSDDLEIIGAVGCRLWVATSGLDTDFTVKLIDEYPPSEDYPDGFALNLVDAIVRLSYRNGAQSRQEVTPDRVYDIKLDMPPVANRFMAGHSLRLDVSSSNAPLFDVNPNTGEEPTKARAWQPARNTVFHHPGRPSVIVLPVSPEAATLEGALADDRVL